MKKKQIAFRLDEKLYNNIRIKLLQENKYKSFQEYLEALIDKDMKGESENENTRNI